MRFESTLFAMLFLLLFPSISFAHGVASSDASFIQSLLGPAFIHYLYLGAKHMVAGVLAGIHANAYLVDAIIGLSVVYKAFENCGGFIRIGWRFDSRVAVLLFGLAHGFGLSTKLQELSRCKMACSPI